MTDGEPTSALGCEIDVSRLEAYLMEHRLEGFAGPIRLEKFAGGQSNPTYLLTAPSSKYVLRRQPFGPLLKSAHAVDREYRVLSVLRGTAVPVPYPYLLCTDTNVIGSMFYIMSFEPGSSYWNPALPELTPEQRRVVYSELIRVLAALHSLDVDQLGLGDWGRRTGYFERQLSVWTKQYRASETTKRGEMEALMEALAARMPPDDGQCSLIHGDYRLDNLIFDAQTLRAKALLDWELSTLGHPLADLAYFCATPRLRPDEHIPGLAGIDREQLGIPTEAQIVQQYSELRGIAQISHWDFYIAFSFFRMAAILQGVYKRALAGNASNAHALESGATVEVVAKAGLEAISR
ncbi:aminoglycoside phosphotransferase [Steroidobacter denitrificans]|uniref:Aminoglycoside phosphotransferase n=1 Tax=Steroidobacter denitrificans TaxID=465721 RepID=A0A127FDF7_STEDE|nr:phosphotransferase family protein [Steroidobacter denitrificans]AMN47681.1 aminoglycoside phosphotransferase [Steroidobacter denitrificans]